MRPIQISTSRGWLVAGRANFLSNLIRQAKKQGNTIYEQLQGNSVIQSSLADWAEVAKDAMKGAGKEVEHGLALLSPTIDATPGRHTIEDTIDQFIFDPKSPIAPLELMALGSVSGSKAALDGVADATVRVARGIAAKTAKSPALTKVGRTLSDPRRVVEAQIRRSGFKLQDKASGEFIDGFRRQLAGKQGPALKKELMASYPDLRKAAGSWDDFAVELFHADPKAARLFMTKSGRRKHALGRGIEKGLQAVEDVFPKDVTPGGLPISGEVIKSEVAVTAGTLREKQRALERRVTNRKQKKQSAIERFWEAGEGF